MTSLEKLCADAQRAVTELIEAAELKKGDLLVVGCSSSEVVGGQIGKNSSMEAAQAIFSGIYPILLEQGIFLAAQCCEHLNRALILEQKAAEHFGCEPVNVRPWAHAGGSFATTVWENLVAPCAVEHVRARAGMDIGDTLIGMHLREVAVPLRLSVKKLGEAHLVCARTRPKFIGGERARYQDALK